jgi:DNA repair protein RecN (Recombination protein N)
MGQGIETGKRFVMIREIRVSNFALIDELSLEFDGGFTVLTGETGAGKSILVDAISLLLGERASSGQIRSGSEEAEVSGLVELPAGNSELARLLDEMAIAPQDGTLIIRRRITRGDRNRILINQTPFPLTALKRLGDRLVDLHGQHNHQSLLDERTHALIIDDLPEVREVRERYRTSYAGYAAAKAEFTAFETRSAELAQRREMLEFQCRELHELVLQRGEEETLDAELRLLSTSVQRSEAVGEIMTLLADSEDSVEKRIAGVRKKLETLVRYDASVQPWLDNVGAMLAVLSELETFCGSYLDKTGSPDPERLDWCNARLAKIQRLKKKYSCSFADLIAKSEKFADDLAAIDNIDADRALRAEKLRNALATCASDGRALRAARQKAAFRLDAQVTTAMERLGFTGGIWKTDFTLREEPLDNGMEEILFLVRTNPGEPMLPLSATASGGEVSRLMLAVKSVMAEHDRIPILIFDEIDTGIGGILAGAVAHALYALARTHQVLCISHLHQIASHADHHFRVYKESAGGRTVTHIERLSEKERIDEIARMLGGDSTAARTHARELLAKRSSA